MADGSTDPIDGPAGAWDSLQLPWRLAYEEAWAAWCAGNFGIGAALVDPATGAVVSVGRNRLNQREKAPGQLSGNFLAHAEMNAFAAMDRVLADGLHLYTTLQPCLMCAGTSIMLGVERVRFAARDRWFDGLEGLWEHHDLTRRKQPVWEGPIGGPLERFARVLPMSFTLLWVPDAEVATRAREREPAVVALAEEILNDPDVRALRDRGAPVSAALTLLWDRLAEPPPPANA